MRLERLQEYLTTATALVIGVGLAYFLGLSVGRGQIGTMLMVVGGLVYLGLILSLRQYLWILIPLCWPLTGQIQELKGSPAVRDAATVAVAAGVFMLVAFKVIRRKPRFEAIDFWVWASLLYLLTVFLRHPTGGELLQSDRVGGRPYLNVAISVVAFWVLVRADLTARWANRMVICIVGVRMLEGMLSAIANIFPSTTPVLARFYSGIDPTTYELEQAGGGPDEGSQRQEYLGTMGSTLNTAIIASARPLSLLNPFSSFAAMLKGADVAHIAWAMVRQSVFMVGLLFILLSGFRGQVLTLGAYFMIISYLRHGIMEVVRLAAAGIMVLIFVIMLQGNVIQFPHPVQRALSFLPGQWSAAAVASGKHSSEWRFYMWREMMTTDRYIENKLLGDGFGFSMQALQRIRIISSYGTMQDQQETFLITGQVHSGPISSIRYVGYIGLFLFMCLSITLAVKAFRACRRSLGTPFQTLTLFVGVPIIWYPISFVFLFGSYDNDLPYTIFNAGMLKMLLNALDTYQAPEAATAPAGSTSTPGTIRRKRLPKQRRLEPTVAAALANPSRPLGQN